VSRDEAAALARGNPLSFLHVSRAEIDLPADIDPYSERVYTTAADNFSRLTREAPLVVEREPSLYFYRLRMGGHAQMGLAASYSLDDYDRDVIRKHERTRRDKEDDRTRHMLTLSAQTGPVFLTYPASAEIDSMAAEVSEGQPLFDFTADDGVSHTVWRVPAELTEPLVAAVGAIPTLYIADGHHRAASAARTRQRLSETVVDAGGHPTYQAAAPHSEADGMLAVAFPDNQVQVLPYNRTVADLAGLTPAEFLSAVNAVVPVRAGGPTPSVKGNVGMYLDGEWYTVDLRGVTAGRDRIAGLDVSVLQDLVIAPILKIEDVRTDKRIDFVGGARGTAALEHLVGSGRAAVAFSMYPVSVSDLIAVADAGGIMPPKSTWFEPKLRDGLLIHQL
jgi:uncharacterized protein (DUF1015 family)